jgi:hypothetical protein
MQKELWGQGAHIENQRKVWEGSQAPVAGSESQKEVPEMCRL